MASSADVISAFLAAISCAFIFVGLWMLWRVGGSAYPRWLMLVVMLPATMRFNQPRNSLLVDVDLEGFAFRVQALAVRQAARPAKNKLSFIVAVSHVRDL
jgi:hypothetical protein